MPEERPASDEVIELRRRNAELAVLFDTVRDLASTLSSLEVIERLVDRTLQHLESEIASVLLVESDGSLRIMHARGLPDSVIETSLGRVGEGIAGHVAASGEALLVEDVERDPRFSRANHERYYNNSCISAPLVDQGRVRGVINVNNKRDRSVFSHSDLRLLGAIATHAAMALRNANRFEELLERAQRDALTGLANHGHFWTMLESEVKRALRYSRPLAVVMIDVDHFKRFNDRHGHLRGDTALVAVARAVAERSRVHDLAARYGGEEFAVLLPETDADGARAFGNKVRAAIEALGLANGSPDDLLTASIGVAALREDDAGAKALVEGADAELYRAKSEGRNRVCVRA